MLKKLRTGLALMEAGKRVKNVQAWKTGQVNANHVASFIGVVLVALGVFTGLEVDIGEEQLQDISTALIGIAPLAYGLYNSFTTIATTYKVKGVLGKPSAKPKRAGAGPDT